MVKKMVKKNVNVLYYGVNFLWGATCTLPSQAFALVNKLLTTCWDGVQEWSFVFFVSNTDIQAIRLYLWLEHVLLVNQKQDVWWPAECISSHGKGSSQLETRVDCTIYRCSTHSGLFLCLKLNIVMFKFVLHWTKARMLTTMYTPNAYSI